MASAVCAPPANFEDEDGEDLKGSYFVDDEISDDGAVYMAGEATDDDADTSTRDEDAVVPETGSFVKSLRTARILFRWDAEASRIVRIALPSTIGSAGEAFCSAATSALVSRHWGADQYVTYSMASVLVGLASALTGGIGDASGVLVAQAVGGREVLSGGTV